MKSLFSAVVSGHPVVLKNGKQICMNRKTGRTFIKSNDRVVSWMEKAKFCLSQVAKNTGTEQIKCKVHVRMMFFGAWKSDGGTTPDLSNLYQSVEDSLQASGVIADDRLIESHDGSRRIYMCDNCPDRLTYKRGDRAGTFKKDCGAVKKCPHERIEIDVFEFEEDRELRWR